MDHISILKWSNRLAAALLILSLILLNHYPTTASIGILVSIVTFTGTSLLLSLKGGN